MKKLVLLFSLGLLQFGAYAQESEPEFETDRPSFTEASSVVPRGYYQLETGFQYQKKKVDGFERKQWLYPQALLRIGVLKSAELRLEATFRQDDYRSGESLVQHHEGLSTVRVGTKIKVLDSQGAWPEMSLLGMLETPWGRDAFEPRQVVPEVMLLFTNKITEKVKFQYNAGFRRQKEEGEMENQLEYSATLTGKLSQKFMLFAEFFGDKPKGSPAENQIDGGIQFMVLPNLQLDAVVGTGVSSHAPEMFAGGGISVRLPR
ncbi:transporter [Sabulibacter ruber]|uniref:transporter n=1 Tax=Sabulibacter ruber TaxID=2811901 RepID=UPI001A970FFA|nr:transporter [Sabulibacter ruber]